MSLSYQAILFDCDGVIVDTEALSNRLFRQALGELGLNLSHQDMHTHFSGYTTESNLKTAAQMLGSPLPEGFAMTLKQRFLSEINTSLEPIPGVRSLLDKIQVPIAMATNANRAEMNFKLEKINLSQRFSVRFCVEDVENPKPAPDLYLKAASALSVAPKDCIVIEDSLAGIAAGRAAGMRVLAYSGDMNPADQLNAGATACFKDMSQLPALLGL